MIDLGTILRALTRTELARVAKIAGVKARSADARIAALVDHASCDVEMVVEQLSVDRLRAVHNKLNLRERGRARKALVARLVGTEHELPGVAAPYSDWLTRMEQFVRDVQPEAYRLAIQPPATEKEVREAERWLGISLPAGFRTTLRTFTRQLDYYWFMEDTPEPPEGWFESPYCGNCSFGLDTLPHMNHPSHFTTAERDNPTSMWAWRLLVVGDGAGNGCARLENGRSGHLDGS